MIRTTRGSNLKVKFPNPLLTRFETDYRGRYLVCKNFEEARAVKEYTKLHKNDVVQPWYLATKYDLLNPQIYDFYCVEKIKKRLKLKIPKSEWKDKGFFHTLVRIDGKYIMAETKRIHDLCIHIVKASIQTCRKKDVKQDQTVVILSDLIPQSNLNLPPINVVLEQIDVHHSEPENVKRCFTDNSVSKQIFPATGIFSKSEKVGNLARILKKKNFESSTRYLHTSSTYLGPKTNISPVLKPAFHKDKGIQVTGEKHLKNIAKNLLHQEKVVFQKEQRALELQRKRRTEELKSYNSTDFNAIKEKNKHKASIGPGQSNYRLSADIRIPTSILGPKYLRQNLMDSTKLEINIANKIAEAKRTGKLDRNYFKKLEKRLGVIQSSTVEDQKHRLGKMNKLAMANKNKSDPILKEQQHQKIDRILMDKIDLSREFLKNIDKEASLKKPVSENILHGALELQEVFAPEIESKVEAKIQKSLIDLESFVSGFQTNAPETKQVLSKKTNHRIKFKDQQVSHIQDFNDPLFWDTFIWDPKADPKPIITLAFDEYEENTFNIPDKGFMREAF